MTALSHADNFAPSYPVHLVLTGRSCLVVGGGNVAVGKVAGLVKTGAHVTVVAPLVLEAVRQQQNVTVVEKPYEPSDLDGHRLVITCTDDPAVNAQVYADAEARDMWANSADDPINCAFTLPSVARQGDLAVSVSTAGRSPALASWLRRRFEAEFDERYADLLEVLSDVRAEARAHFGTSEIRGWIEALDNGLFDLVATGDLETARSFLRQSIDLPEAAVSALGEQPLGHERESPTQSVESDEVKGQEVAA